MRVTDALGERDERDVEDKEERGTDVLSEDGPAIVFGSLAVATLSPVVITQP